MKILSSFLTGLFFLCIAATAQAAIVYTDFGADGTSPELTIESTDLWGGSTLNTKRGDIILDLPGSDSENLPFLRYDYGDLNGGSIEITVKLWNLYYIGPETVELPYKLDKGISVGEDSDWVSRNGVKSDSGGLYEVHINSEVDAYWEDMKEGETGYLGFAFDNDGTTLYGWIELYVDAESGEFIVYGYAYEDTGAAILTGDTGSSVPVPGTIFLLGTGLVGLAGSRRRNA